MPPRSKRKTIDRPTNHENKNTNTHSRSKPKASKQTTTQPVIRALEATEGEIELEASSKEGNGNVNTRRTPLPRIHKNVDPAEPDRPRPRRSSQEVQAQRLAQENRKLEKMKELHEKEEELKRLRSMLGDQQAMRERKARTRAYDLLHVLEDTENEGYESEGLVEQQVKKAQSSDSLEYINVDDVSDDSSKGIAEIESNMKQAKPTARTAKDAGGAKGKRVIGSKVIKNNLAACQPSGKTGLSKRFKTRLVQEGNVTGGLGDSDVKDFPPGEAEEGMGSNEPDTEGNDAMITCVNASSPAVSSQPGSKDSSRQPSVQFNPLPKKGTARTQSRPTAQPVIRSQPSSRSVSQPASRTRTPAGSRAHSPNPPPAQASGRRAGQRVGTTAKDYPEFIKGSEWSGLVLPTARHAMFASEQPMVKFRRDEGFCAIVQEIITRTFPEMDYVCSLDRDPVLQQVYNRLNETRSGIASKVLKVVTNFFSQPKYAGNYTKILDYATWAGTRLEDGPAFYAKPSPRNIKPGSENYVPPSGLFESHFVIEVMKCYMAKRAKSHIDYGHPVGLIGLVRAAIKRAFRYYVKSEGGPPIVSLIKDSEKFSEANMGKHVTAFIGYAVTLADDDWARLMEVYEFVPDPPTDEEGGVSSDSEQSIKLYVPR
ncbi:hypothetical protein E1B28_002147 [Marasmius oreades]|uniref:Uncharacterized protein n=1 Tax=Marasmius oreades TaxID=181124 RepID=A0A9P7RM08_9AGAR|nr:uncharacterized protein E1B28_002147 [Marasmius oreades]KAG7086186.1 hypothetical protein E1B28_002147 [Marasmius oreades]